MVLFHVSASVSRAPPVQTLRRYLHGHYISSARNLQSNSRNFASARPTFFRSPGDFVSSLHNYPLYFLTQDGLIFLLTKRRNLRKL